jgi:Dolichyl-phosphate-mannose-protein mannosyltransferase
MPVPAAEPAPPSPRRLTQLKALPWPLLLTMAVQVVLSSRLARSNTAFVDEATYLYAGHQEIHSIIANGTLTAPGQNGYYQVYFSGAPVLYPILGAIADSVAGLAAARLLSLAFMLAATALLYLTTDRLYGRRAGAFASAIFAILGPTQFLSAFATHDAMALFLMALAAFLAVQSAKESDNKLFLFYACLAMVLADATKYAVILFNPAIIGLCVLASVPYRGWPRARRQGYRMLGYAGTLTAALVAIGDHTYLKGLMSTTIARAEGNFPAAGVLRDSWHWLGGVAVMAAIAVVLHAFREQRARTWLAVLLSLAFLLVPLNQARIHTSAALQKHVDFGAWFGAILAGYVIAAVLPAARRKALNAVTALTAAIAMAAVLVTITRAQATDLYQSWNNSSHEITALRSWAKQGKILAEDYFIYSYYLSREVGINRWANTWHLEYIDPSTHQDLSGPAAYRSAIKHHYFGTIALDYGTTRAIDHQIIQDMITAGGYRRVAHIRYGHVWFDVFHDARAR